jgi:hypothetical protein
MLKGITGSTVNAGKCIIAKVLEANLATDKLLVIATKQ